MTGLTLAFLGIYLVAVVALSRGGGGGGAVDYLLAGRRLTLPAFVATLVTTWYGGILGVGEYAYSFGMSTWLVFGVPYYGAALLFAFVVAKRLRASSALTIPDLLTSTYGRRAGITGAAAILALTLPVAYLLMLATLVSQLTGCSPLLATLVAAAFSAIYVGISGFRAVVRTDVLQMALMFGGFFILLPAAVDHIGGFASLWHGLPETHRSWDGGLGWQTVAVWYLIALQTMVEPAFYQRVFAARNPDTARRGIVLSVALWVVFDFCTTFSGLAARVLLPDLADPVAAYPALAELVLPTWLAALFTVGLFATVMSTLDSYLFLAASTIGHDLRMRFRRSDDEQRRTRYGLVISAILAIVGALTFHSPVQVWHHVGSVITSALLLPVIGIHFPARWRFRELGATVAMVSAAAVATMWIIAGDDGGYPLGVEPMFPALATCIAVWLADTGMKSPRSSSR